MSLLVSRVSGNGINSRRGSLQSHTNFQRLSVADAVCWKRDDVHQAGGNSHQLPGPVLRLQLGCQPSAEGIDQQNPLSLFSRQLL